MTTEIIIALVILVAMLVLYMTEWIPLVVTAVLGCFAFYVTGIISASDALAGFSNNTLLMIIGILITGVGLSSSGFAKWLGQRLIKVLGTNERRVMAIITAGSGIMSAFIQNGACNSAFLPMIDAISESSNGKIKSKNLVMAMGLAVSAGGVCTLIGSTPQMISQGLLESAGYRMFTFAELGIVGFPILAFLVLYFSTFGYKHVIKVVEYMPDKEISSESVSGVGEQKFTIQMGCAAAALVFMIIGLAAQLWTNAWVALISGMFVIVTGCVKPKVALSKVNWNSVFIIAMTMGVGKGLSASGAAEFLADTVANIVGNNASPTVVLIVCGVLFTVMGNFMSHTSVLTLMVPIFIPVAEALQLNPTTLIYAITLYTSSASTLPLGKASYTMTMAEGYAMKDYAKTNWPVNAAAFVIITVICSVMFAMG